MRGPIYLFTKGKTFFVFSDKTHYIVIMEKPLWGVPLWVTITPDGYRVGDVYHSIEEAEEAAKASILRLEIIRIQ